MKDEVSTILKAQAQGVGNTQDNNLITLGDSQRFAVRRITPLEAERLQGYPDGWTDIGDYVDQNGKKKSTSDSARYKALGNSICLPFWKVLCKRISAMYDRDATMASLFDGIGGFPLCWQQINGDGTAIWSSEIEDFPIAVTEKHFGENGDWLKYMSFGKYWGDKYGL